MLGHTSIMESAIMDTSSSAPPPAAPSFDWFQVPPAFAFVITRVISYCSLFGVFLLSERK